VNDGSAPTPAKPTPPTAKAPREQAELLVGGARSNPDFPRNIRAQTAFLHTVAYLYERMPPPDQQWTRARLIELVPRVRDDPRPQRAAEGMMALGRGRRAMEEISRAVKAGIMPAVPWLGMPGEEIYETLASGWIASYLQWVRNAEVPLGYHFWAAITAIGAAARFNIFIDRGIEDIRLNHYVVLVGERAAGKSIARDAALDILERMNRHIEPDPDKFHPSHVRLMPEDTNQETLVRKLAAWSTTARDAESGEVVKRNVDSTGLLALDELASFLGKDQWAVGKRLPFLTTLYNRTDYVYETQSGGRHHLRNIALSMLACSAPEWMKETITPLLFGGGFMDRCQFISRSPVSKSVRSYPTAQPRDPLIANHLAGWLVQWAHRPQRLELLADPEAADWYDEWYNRLGIRGSSEEEITTSTKRQANRLWRLAGILAMSEECAPWIRQRHFAKGHQLLLEEDREFIRFMAKMNESPAVSHMDYLQGVLLRHGGSMLRSDLFQIVRRRKGLSPPKRYATPYLESMEAEGRLKITREGRGVRYTLVGEGLKVGEAPHKYGKEFSSRAQGGEPANEPAAEPAEPTEQAAEAEGETNNE
jgi:hypothetical protein